MMERPLSAGAHPKQPLCFPPSSIAGTLLLALAAAGGVIMNLAYHLTDKLIPQWLLHLHIALTAAGTVLVLWGASA